MKSKEITVGDVKQRLQWIPPGEFLMGSPMGEDYAYPDEVPQHKVTLTKGFWMFDTPVTQALWQAVMGNNPSRFKEPTRPVENVSWCDCQEFIKNINMLVPGLLFNLPSEAQWEYACRAGSSGDLYSCPTDVTGHHDGPTLDEIAWYTDNSNPEPAPSGSGTRAGTHPVGLKLPNDWGLYDMLGNVWEWCLDGKRKYTDEEVINPVGPTGPGAERVLRGGSWGDIARGCRCAYRSRNFSDYRSDGIGFRCVAQEKGFESKMKQPHYERCRIQPIDYIVANNLGFCEGNIVKYITRYKDKNGVEDLQKAKYYIEKLIEMEESENGS